MSDNWILLIPSDPNFQPTRKAARQANALLASFAPKADAVNAVFEHQVVFYDPGGNWSGVQCPACGKDASPWWADAMDAAYMKKFSDLGTVAPCCGASVSLNALHYESPAAFGHFVLEVMNPRIKRLSAARTRQLAKTLGCQLTTVNRHL